MDIAITRLNKEDMLVSLEFKRETIGVKFITIRFKNDEYHQLFKSMAQNMIQDDLQYINKDGYRTSIHDEELKEKVNPSSRKEKVGCANDKCPNLVDPETAHDSVYCSMTCWQSHLNVSKETIPKEYICCYVGCQEVVNQALSQCSKHTDSEPSTIEPPVGQDGIDESNNIGCCFRKDCDNVQVPESNYCDDHKPRKKLKKKYPMCVDSDCRIKHRTNTKCQYE